MRRALMMSVLLAIATAAVPAGARTNSQDCLGDPPAEPVRRIEACTAVIDLSSGPREERSVAFTNRGNAHHLTGDNARAMADFDRAIEIDPRNAIAHNNRGNVHSDLGDQDRAIADYTRAVEIDRKFVEAFNNRGASYEMKGDLDRAIADYDRAIGIFRKYPRSLVNRGGVYLKKGDFKRALQDVDEALRYEPERAASLAFSCWARAVANVDLERALDHCNRALQAQPRAARLDSRGFVNFRMGRFREAIADYDAALAKDPELMASLYMRGVAKLRLGDAAGGNADIAAARAKEPEVAARYAGYGVAP